MEYGVPNVNKPANIPGLNQEKNVRIAMNRSNNNPDKRKFKVVWDNNADFPIRITNYENNSVSSVSMYVPDNFIHGSGSYLLETSDYPQYIHIQVWKLLQKQHDTTLKKIKREKRMKVDLRKTTKNSLNELTTHCLDTYSRLMAHGGGISQFEKGKAFAMLEIGKKLEKIMYKER